MGPRLITFLAAAAVLLCGLVAAPVHAQCSTSAQTWHCWETTLPLQNVTGNLYRDLKVRVTFTQLGQSRTTYAFWDGQNTLKIRMFFPAAGTWSWSTTCEAGCSLATGHTVSGQSVTVASSSPPGLFPSVVLNGYPRVSGCGLVYANGQLFQWLGDTAWNAPILATPAAWTSYLQDRASRGFTVIQIALPVDYMDPPRNDQPFDQQSPRQSPFLNPATDTGNPLPKSTSQWNPAFWREFDRKILEANEDGIAVVVVGLMEGVVEKDLQDKFCPPLLADSQTYARNVAARLAGLAVILSPGFDRFSGSGGNKECAGREPVLTRIQSIGQVIKATAPHLLVTNHWAGQTDVSELISFQNDPANSWLDFQLYQSGQSDLFLQRARTFPLAFRSVSDPTVCTKANVNGEAIYDFGSSYPHSDYGVRQTAYFSLLSGAGGYTYGTTGIYDWSNPSVGLGRVSNLHMQWFQRVGVWMDVAPLVPKHSLVLNVPPSEDKRILLAKSAVATKAVAYLPGNPEVSIDFSGLPGMPTNGRWFDPRNGTFPDSRYAQGTLVSGTTYKFCQPCGTVTCPLPPGAPQRPACPPEADWVLLLP